jgi:hypothetical protein
LGLNPLASASCPELLEPQAHSHHAQVLVEMGVGVLQTFFFGGIEVFFFFCVFVFLEVLGFELRVYTP